MTVRPRVLVVDDSAFARTVISRMLRASGAIDVIGTAGDGRAALDQIEKLAPDVVTLDLTMPNVDGLDVLRALAGRRSPRVIVVSISNVDSERGVEALALGAVELITKPSALASDRLHEISSALIAAVLAVTQPVPAAVEPAPPVVAASGTQLVVIGTSTGGPQALTRVISALPEDLAAPIAIALHIPPGYTAALSARLDRVSHMHVVEASSGLELVPGLAVIARGGEHLRIIRRGNGLYAEVSPLPVRPFTPSVDELLLSAARACGGHTLGVVLTGMGDDGLVGARAIAAAGGSLLTESASTCVVYGMPRCIDEARIGAVSAPLEQMAHEIVRRI
ncbi:MAG TPA: chemotaxis-specific protein-glutamate methyltransferase CheB [Kofleriaceae bacterium]